MTCSLRSSANVLNNSPPCTFKWTSETSNNHSESSANSCCSEKASYDNNDDFCCSRTRRSDNNRRSCGCLANNQIRNNGYRISGKTGGRDKGSFLRGIMAWMSSNGCELNSACHKQANAHRRRRRHISRGCRPGGAALILALCVTGMAISRGGMGVAAARLPIIDEVYRPNGGEPGLVGNPGNVEVDPASLGSVAEQQQALLEYLEDPPFQSQMYTQQQLMQLALRLRENPELLAQIMALTPAARRYSLSDEVIARMPAAAVGAIEATPAPPQPKRGNYMALCHFKICNMGRKRRQDGMP